MLATLADIQLHVDFKHWLTYYEMVFWDEEEMKRHDKLVQDHDVVSLQSMIDEKKFAFTKFQVALLTLLEWNTLVDFNKYIEHVNKLAADARELKKMLTDIYVSQEEENKRELNQPSDFIAKRS